MADSSVSIRLYQTGNLGLPSRSGSVAASVSKESVLASCLSSS